HEVTGFIVHSEEEAARVVDRCAALDRAQIRRVFEERFSVQRMADEYEKLYESMVESREFRVYAKRAQRWSTSRVGLSSVSAASELAVKAQDSALSASAGQSAEAAQAGL
ncbi:MAG: hypothetical protein ACPLRM_10355, partial [Anaerolineae bacterium]